MITKVIDKLMTMESVSEDHFPEWLNSELEKRNWSQRELARHAGITSGTISNLISGMRGRGIASLTAIAKALNLPPTSVFRAAGVLPEEPEYIPLLDEWNAVFYDLTPDDREEILDIARMKANKHKVTIKKTSRREAPARTALKNK